MKKLKITRVISAVIFTLLITACSNGNSDSTPEITTTGGTDSPVTEISFGMWPQTIKSDDVVIDENDSRVQGAFTYFKGSDGAWYVKQIEKGFYQNYAEYSNGVTVAMESENSIQYFKVEPIKWYICTNNFNGTGKKFIIAKEMLTNGVFYDNANGNNPYPNNYEQSRVRALLNGISYNLNGSLNNEFVDKGFLQTAFTAQEQTRIAVTEVDNSADSIVPVDNPNNWNSSASQYICNNTQDKIFLPSIKELTNSEYGFKLYNENDDLRMKKGTDFAKATGASQGKNDEGCVWWTRTPSMRSDDAVRVNFDGRIWGGNSVNLKNHGIIPALCLN